MLGSDCALGVWTPCCYPHPTLHKPSRSPPHPPTPSPPLSPQGNMWVCCVAELSGDVQSVQFPFFQRGRSVETHKLHMFFQDAHCCFLGLARSRPLDSPICSDFTRLVRFSPSCRIIARSCLNSEFGTFLPRRFCMNQQHRCSSNFCFL